MSTFRDDREARVAELEHELATKGAPEDIDELRAQVEALAKRVAAAAGEAEENGRSFRELLGAMRRIGAKLGASTSEDVATDPPRAVSAMDTHGWAYMGFLIVVALLGAWSLFHRSQSGFEELAPGMHDSGTSAP